MFVIYFMLVLLVGTNAHLCAFHKGMYCVNGNETGVVNLNANTMVNPLFNLTEDLWFLHHVDHCDDFPPPDEDAIELIPGESFSVQIATNQAFTNLSNDGRDVSIWADGKTYPKDCGDNPSCITDPHGCIFSPNMHTQNQSMVAGTAFAIAYKSDITEVTLEDFVVFSVLTDTPWNVNAAYPVPEGMPPCPNGLCICAWGWIPNGCGTANIYMFPYKCRVVASNNSLTIGKPKPAVWCEDDQDNCVSGPKQMIIWHQLEGNNIEVSGNDLSGYPKSPAYNHKLGFKHGAQNDIFIPPSGTGSDLSPSQPPASETLPSQPPPSQPPASQTSPSPPPPSQSPPVSSKSPTCKHSPKRVTSW